MKKRFLPFFVFIPLVLVVMSLMFATCAVAQTDLLRPTPTVPVDLDLRLRIPVLGFEAEVVEVPLVNRRWQVEDLGQLVGHLGRTSFPDEAGNVVLAAHVRLDDRPGPFFELYRLRTGDELLVDYQGATWRYVVDAVYVTVPEDVQVTYPTRERTLTLITCQGAAFEWRLVVRAELQEVTIHDD